MWFINYIWRIITKIGRTWGPYLNDFFSMTSVDIGKVLNLEIFTKHCRCKDGSNHTNVCSVIYKGTSRVMKTAGFLYILFYSVLHYHCEILHANGRGCCHLSTFPWKQYWCLRILVMTTQGLNEKSETWRWQTPVR